MAGDQAAEEGDGKVMTINEVLQEALSILDVPVYPKVFEGTEDSYIVFNYNTVPIDFADDAPEHERYLIQVHFFCPLGSNSLSDAKQIREALFEAGMTWPEVSDASDQSGQHLVFECEMAEGICYGED